MSKKESEAERFEHMKRLQQRLTAKKKKDSELASEKRLKKHKANEHRQDWLKNYTTEENSDFSDD